MFTSIVSRGKIKDMRKMQENEIVSVTDAQLQAAFLAARELGKILEDDVLRAVIIAARRAS